MNLNAKIHWYRRLLQGLLNMQKLFFFGLAIVAMIMVILFQQRLHNSASSGYFSDMTLWLLFFNQTLMILNVFGNPNMVLDRIGRYEFLMTRPVEKGKIYWALVSVVVAICILPIILILVLGMIQGGDLNYDFNHTDPKLTEFVSTAQIAYPETTLTDGIWKGSTRVHIQGTSSDVAWLKLGLNLIFINVLLTLIMACNLIRNKWLSKMIVVAMIIFPFSTIAITQYHFSLFLLRLKIYSIPFAIAVILICVASQIFCYRTFKEIEVV